MNDTQEELDELISDLEYALRGLTEGYRTDDSNIFYTERLVDTKKTIQAYVATKELEARIDELESLKEQTRKVTHPDAFISDVSMAQDIRVHTNSLIEYRLAVLTSLAPSHTISIKEEEDA